MKYMKKIILENFQSHKYTEIELEEKLNIIVGPSDSGKTAILRAVKWALYNEPSGDFFIREGEKETTVTLIFSDNTKVIRYRSKSKNAYELLYNNGESLRLEGFGTGVPEEVKEAIGIHKINLDSNENIAVNLAEQLEGPFLLSEKTSTRASAIGQLVGVDVIDEALREVLKDVRALNTTKKNLEEDINELTEDIKTYDYVEGLKTTIANLINIKKKLVESQKLLDSLDGSSKQLIKLYEEMDKFKKIKDGLKRLDESYDVLNVLENKYTTYWQLTNYNNNLNKVRRSIANNEILLNGLIHLDKSVEVEEKLIGLVEDYRRLLNLNIKYSRVKKESLTLNNSLILLNEYLKQEDKPAEIEKIYDQLIILNNLKQKYNQVKSNIKKGNNYIESFKFIDNIVENDKVLANKIVLLKKLNKLSIKSETIKEEINNEMANIDKLKSDNEKLFEKYKSILNRIEKCPLCFSEIDNKKVEHIMNHY